MDQSISFLEFLRNRIDDFTYMFLTSLGFLSAYYWLYLKFTVKIRSVFLRRNIVGLILLAVYSAYYFTLLYGKTFHQLGGNAEKMTPYLKAYYSMAISVWICFNLYYLFTLPLIKNGKLWAKGVKYFVFFLMVISAMIGTNWPLYGSSLLKTIPFYPMVAFMVVLVDAGCQYVMRLQSLKRKAKELENFKLKEQLAQAQLDALHAKINPHFLYNSLNSIAGLALNKLHFANTKFPGAVVVSNYIV